MPRPVPLAPSEPKFRFISRLELDHPGRQHIYGTMKAEAEVAWERLQRTRDALLLHLKDRPSILQPFTHGQISEQALNREILAVYQNASPQTKPYYDLAYEPGVVNWIIKWLVWHIFRDRDQRKKPRARPQELAGRSTADADAGEDFSSLDGGQLGGQVHTPFSSEEWSSQHTDVQEDATSPRGRGAHTYTLRQGLLTTTAAPVEQQQNDLQVRTASSPVSQLSTMPYDPVRDL